MGSNNFWRHLRPAWGVLLLSPCLAAQGSGVLSVAPLAQATVQRKTELQVKLPVLLRSGYHTNSNTPSESYLIPLRLVWEPGPLEPVEVIYPKPHLEKYAFSPKPLSVFTGNFEIVTKFKVAGNAPAGPGIAVGKLRYQACNNDSCLPPKTIDVKLPVLVQ